MMHVGSALSLAASPGSSRFADSKWPNRESGGRYWFGQLWLPLLRRTKELRWLGTLARRVEESADLDVVRVDEPGQARDKRGLVMTSPRRNLRGCMRTAGRAVTGGVRWYRRTWAPGRPN